MRKRPVSTAKGVVKWQEWYKARESIHYHPRRAWITLALVVMVIAGGGVAWFVSRPDNYPATRKLAHDNGYAQTIRELKDRPLPADPLKLAYHYSQIGHSYEALENYAQALHYYLEGQSVVELRNLHAEVSFYVAIADMYTRLGETQKAAEYTKKAEDHRKNFSGKNEPKQVIEATLGEAQ